MRLLFVSEFLPKWNSGAEGSLLSIGEALEKRGHTISYLWRDSAPAVLPHPRLYDLFELPRRQLRRVDASLQSSHFDVVILSQPYSYLVFEKLVRRYPRTLFLNRTHGWEDRMSESWNQLGWRQNSAFRKHLSDLSADATHRACRRTAQSCHGVIASSQLCADYIKNHYSINHQSVGVIPYGIDHHLFQSTSDDSQKSGRMLFVGQFLPRKGSKVLEQILPFVASHCPGASMTFVVPESQMAQVESAFRPSFAARLSLLPWTTRESLGEIYRQHNILLFPSFFEGFGKVFLEAMAAGLCVVGFREGGLHDVATHSRDALLCQTGDVHAFRILTECALGDPSWVRQLGQNAREVARRYTWERNAIETESFCLGLRQIETPQPAGQLIVAA